MENQMERHTADGWMPHAETEMEERGCTRKLENQWWTKEGTVGKHQEQIEEQLRPARTGAADVGNQEGEDDDTNNRERQ